jgi:hypothetical protein
MNKDMKGKEQERRQTRSGVITEEDQNILASKYIDSFDAKRKRPNKNSKN